MIILAKIKKKTDIGTILLKIARNKLIYINTRFIASYTSSANALLSV